jgi:hypothetical protein
MCLLFANALVGTHSERLPEAIALVQAICGDNTSSNSKSSNSYQDEDEGHESGLVRGYNHNRGGQTALQQTTNHDMSSTIQLHDISTIQVGGDRSRARVLGVDDTVSSDDSDEDHFDGGGGDDNYFGSSSNVRILGAPNNTNSMQGGGGSGSNVKTMALLGGDGGGGSYIVGGSGSSGGGVIGAPMGYSKKQEVKR